MTDAAFPPLVRLRGLCKRFGTQRALDGVSLTIDAPAIVGVVGPDGAGKTTFIRTLAGLLEIDADEAVVLGYDLRGDVTELKARTGYVAQTFSLQRDLSVIENLRFTARLQRLAADVFAARSRELLERTGLAPFAERAAGALSGGMRQKLAIANALLPDPELLLLDEPTAGVDVLARAEIWDLLQRQRAHTLIIISTSYLDEAANCDRLLYLDGGRAVAFGTPRELAAHVAVEVYRIWGDAARATARAARALEYVVSARATGRFARIEIDAARAPQPAQTAAALRALDGAAFVEPMPVDMESTLLALARAGGTRHA